MYIAVVNHDKISYSNIHRMLSLNYLFAVAMLSESLRLVLRRRLRFCVVISFRMSLPYFPCPRAVSHVVAFISVLLSCFFHFFFAFLQQMVYAPEGRN